MNELKVQIAEIDARIIDLQNQKMALVELFKSRCKIDLPIELIKQQFDAIFDSRTFLLKNGKAKTINVGKNWKYETSGRGIFRIMFSKSVELDNNPYWNVCDLFTMCVSRYVFGTSTALRCEEILTSTGKVIGLDIYSNVDQLLKLK